VVLDPRETGQLRNFLGYTFPPAPEVQTGPLQRAALNDLNMIWSGLQRGGISGDAIARLGQTGDPRLGWIVSDLLRFIPPGELTDGAISAFQSLTGVRLADDPVALRSPWQSVTDHLLAWDLPVFDGYAEYKERLFTLVEAGWQPFFDDVDSDIDWRIVSWGGVLIDNRELGDPRLCPRGCIPALDNPGVTDVEGGSWYPDDGIVFAVVLGGEARAYPRHIMEIHEMINDTLGGRRIGMPYCTLCGSAQAYLTEEVPDGVATPSGTSSVRYAWAEPHSVQYGMPMRRPPSVSLIISWISMMWRGYARASPPSTTANTMPSSGYQEPPSTSVTPGLSRAGMQPRGHSRGSPSSRLSMSTPPQLTMRQSMSESTSSKNGCQPASTSVNSRSLYSA